MPMREHATSLPHCPTAVPYLCLSKPYSSREDADYWLIKYNQAIDKTYRELASDYAPYANFAAYRNKRIYGRNTNRIAYYEELPFRPDLLLEDIVKIFHPEVFPADTLKYFTNLAD